MSVSKIATLRVQEENQHINNLGSNPSSAEVFEHNQRVIHRLIHDLGGRLLGGEIIDGSPKAQKIESLLRFKMPLREIASVIDTPVEEVRLYIANRTIPAASKLTSAQIVKIDTLLTYQVPDAEISTILEVSQAVIGIYKKNLQYLVLTPLAAPRIPPGLDLQPRTEGKREEHKRIPPPDRPPPPRPLAGAGAGARAQQAVSDASQQRRLSEARPSAGAGAAGAPAQHGAGGRTSQQRRLTEAPSASGSADFAGFIMEFGKSMTPFLQEQAYQGLSSDVWLQYKAAPLPLHWAVEHGHTHLFGNHRWDILKKNAEGYTPIEWAALKGVAHAIKPLIDLGANKNQLHSSGCTPLFFAAEQGHADVIKELGRYNADPNFIMDKTTNPVTALYKAVRANKAEAVKALLEIGADPKLEVGGRAAFQEAAIRGHVEIAKLLLPYAKDDPHKTINLKQGSILESAACGPSPLPIIRMLYDAKGSLVFKDFLDKAFTYAVCNSHGDQAEAVEYLITKGVKLDKIKEATRFCEPKNAPCPKPQTLRVLQNHLRKI